MAEYKTLIVNSPSDGVVRVTLNRVDVRNAQDFTMLYELDDAFLAAARDDSAKCIILAANGPHFSSGHDQFNRGTHDQIDTKGTWFGYDRPGIEGLMSRNKETYFDLVWRWRNLPKPIIGQVHGKTIGGGLELLFICDIIIASDDALFADPTVSLGCNGVEFFAHPWELGPRKAKELLFTSDFFTAQDAYEAGLVNRVVSRDQLADATLTMAKRIATKPSLGLTLAKEAVNGMLDAQSQYAALRAAFSLCSLGHANLLLGHRPQGTGGPRLFQDHMKPSDAGQQ